jgi:D-lyxose ketol-isomerase
MKRSQINALLRQAEEFIRQNKFYLPPFAYWSPSEWQTKGPEAAEIVQNFLGWDVTDFGLGDFARYGLVLFTPRNGSPENLKTGRGKLYAEKLLIVDENQVTPLHFHWSKTEDIINRGGGKLAFELFNSAQDESLSTGDVTVEVDGITRTLPAGGRLLLSPGESLTVPTCCYHRFWAEGGRVMAGEVSVVNDDLHDNRFLDAVGRFPRIEEDEPPLYLLVTDYARYYRPAG